MTRGAPGRARPQEAELYDLHDAQGRRWRCLVVRVARKGMLGYFYPGAATELQPGTAVAALMVTPFGVRDGSWILQGTLSGFDRARWPVPAFYRVEPEEQHYREVRYSDDLTGRTEHEIPARPFEPLREDGLHGSQAAAALLATVGSSDWPPAEFVTTR